MASSVHTEVRAALRDDRRVSVAVTSSGAGGQKLKMLIAAGSGATQGPPLPKPGQVTTGYEKPDPGLRSPTHLTRRELQVLKLVAQGLHNRDIAARIHRSIKTVEKHRQNLHHKLSTHEVAGLTRQALSLGVMQKSGRWAHTLPKAKQLTARELEILKLVAQGSGNKWIASELQRSIKTIDHHRENIMKKLGIHQVAGLTRYAVSIGLM